MKKDWKEQWLYHPHPAIVALVLAGSLLALWRGPVRSLPLRDPEALGTLAEGTITVIISQEHVEPSISSRTTTVQNLVVHTDAGKDVEVRNDLTPLQVGDHLYLNVSLAGTDDESYSIVDYKRISGLVWLAAIFALVVLAVSGWKGVNALVGLIFSVAVIFSYAVPAILAHGDPVLVGLVAAAGILIGTFYISYGFDRKSLSALAGIAVTLVLVGVVSQYVVGALRFTGYTDESTLYLNSATANGINLVGLVVAGIIIAAIGVLDDVAITQASAVYELAQAGSVRGWQLFRRAMRVGSDHISAVTNTLVLAYAGAALPLILLLHLSNFPLSFSIGGEAVAQEVVRTLVSSIGLVLAVPLTTAVAVFFVQKWGPGQGDGHSH